MQKKTVTSCFGDKRLEKKGMPRGAVIIATKLYHSQV